MIPLYGETMIDGFKFLDSINELDEEDDVSHVEKSEEQCKEELALLDWLWSFPIVSGSSSDKYTFQNTWEHSSNSSFLILLVVSEVLDTKVIHHKETAKCHWEKIISLVFGDDWNYQFSRNICLNALAALLFRAINKSCCNRIEYLHRILNLSPETQEILMVIIKNAVDDCKTIQHDESRDDVDGTDETKEDKILNQLTLNCDSESLLIDDDSTTSRQGKSPSHFRFEVSPLASPRLPRSHIIFPQPSAGVESPPSIGRDSSSSRDSQDENDILSQNMALLNEITEMRGRETMLIMRLEEMEAKHRAEKIKEESAAIIREDNLRQKYELRIARLEKELKVANEVSKRANDSKQEVITLKTEIDMLRHTKEALLQTESQMQRLKEKLNRVDLDRIELMREIDQHNETKKRCQALENEVTILRPLLTNYNEYKSKAGLSDTYSKQVENLEKKLVTFMNTEVTLKEQAKINDALREDIEMLNSDKTSLLMKEDQLKRLVITKSDEIRRLNVTISEEKWKCISLEGKLCEAENKVSELMSVNSLLEQLRNRATKAEIQLLEFEVLGLI